MYYTYLWLREDGAPYYVGKGKEDRAFVDHWMRDKVRRVPPKERIVVYPAESEEDALGTEIALIWYYGRKDLGTGCLRNLTEGGENPPNHKGKKRSKEHCESIGNAHRGISPSEETRRKQAEAKLGTVGYWRGKTRTFSKEHREALAVAATGKTLSTKGKPWSAARREAQNRRSL